LQATKNGGVTTACPAAGGSHAPGNVLYNLRLTKQREFGYGTTIIKANNIVTLIVITSAELSKNVLYVNI